MEDDPLDLEPGAGARAQAALSAERWADPVLIAREEQVQTSPLWKQLCEALAPAGWSDRSRMDWVVAPNAYLEGRSPAEALWDDPDDLTAEPRLAIERAIPRLR